VGKGSYGRSWNPEVVLLETTRAFGSNPLCVKISVQGGMDAGAFCGVTSLFFFFANQAICDKFLMLLVG